MNITINTPQVIINNVDTEGLILKLESTKKEILEVMSDSESKIIAAFDEQTTRIAKEIEDLIKNPPADDAEFNAALQLRVDALKALGAGGSVPSGPPGPGA